MHFQNPSNTPPSKAKIPLRGGVFTVKPPDIPAILNSIEAIENKNYGKSTFFDEVKTKNKFGTS